MVVTTLVVVASVVVVKLADGPDADRLPPTRGALQSGGPSVVGQSSKPTATSYVFYSTRASPTLAWRYAGRGVAGRRRRWRVVAGRR